MFTLIAAVIGMIMWVEEWILENTLGRLLGGYDPANNGNAKMANMKGQIARLREKYPGCNCFAKVSDGQYIAMRYTGETWEAYERRRAEERQQQQSTNNTKNGG